MKTTLVSFLGKNSGDLQTGYRTATYRFPDGHDRVTPFFGLALEKELRPDFMVILGTAGSMWDVLIEHLADDAEAEEARIELMEAVRVATVDAALLERLQPVVARQLGCPVALRLIPYGRDDEEQAGILRAIAEAVPPGRVHIDLTHGFRHLAALGLLSAFFLERMARLDVKGLYYGALDMTQGGITPVLRLNGLLAIQRWIDALDRFDQNGDYGVFADLLLADGIAQDKVNCLKKAAFFERTFNLRDAARQLGTFLATMDEDLPGTGRLFQQSLSERLAWARGKPLHQQQRHLAYVYLNRRDFVRAAVLAWEAIITLECTRHDLDFGDYAEDGDRKQAEAELKSRLRTEGTNWKEAPQRRIKDLRNALAHGSPPASWAGDLRQALAAPAKLYEMLNRDMKAALD
ncbi:MAG TPA: TIGR02221 family CRISPR-associated protein [Thiobacillaceae bacterium]|nr:TIGR02221 family CRISPR-associated protein [Thiobacillaceae bacterium]HNU63510.1 TIGR02221 family CRISPR-associated protein [Thiobacillaceae bacterium]